MSHATKCAADETSAVLPSRERPIDAAAVVFTRDGLAAMATGEISRVAKVNEAAVFPFAVPESRASAKGACNE